MKVRAHYCMRCAHLWTAPVRYSKHFFGEATVYCPRCRSRDVASGPHQDFPDIDITESKWEWFGKAGHFIAGNDCRFHLATKVGDFLVSTVGEYLPDESAREVLAKAQGITLTGKGDARLADFIQKYGYVDIGHNRKYETMVFRTLGELCTCGCGQPRIDPQSLLLKGYNNAVDARRGHLEICYKVSAGWQPEEEDSGNFVKEKKIATLDLV